MSTNNIWQYNLNVKISKIKRKNLHIYFHLYILDFFFYMTICFHIQNETKLIIILKQDFQNQDFKTDQILKCISLPTHRKIIVSLLTNSQTDIQKFLTYPLIPYKDQRKREKHFYSFPLCYVYIMLPIFHKIQ